MRRIWKFLRYVLIIAFVGWAATAAAFHMWREMVFFLAYAGVVYLLNIFERKGRDEL